MEIVNAAGLADLAALSALADPTRRRLYGLVVEAGRPLGRDEAVAAVGISRSLAAYHLDKLAEQGLLEVEYARTLTAVPGSDNGSLKSKVLFNAAVRF